MSAEEEELLAEGDEVPVDEPTSSSLEPLNEGEAYVHVETTKGSLVMRLNQHWSPLGYERLLSLMQAGFYEESHFYRVIPNFLVQFGISYTHNETLQQFANKPFTDDPQLDPPIPFVEGTIAYAGSGPNSRTSQIFISYGRNPGLGRMPWETPVGSVVSGMEVAHQFYSYGDGPPHGKGPGQPQLHRPDGKEYANREFPLMDAILKTTVVTYEEQERQAQQLLEQYERFAAGRSDQQKPAVGKDKERLLRRVHKKMHVDDWGIEMTVFLVMVLLAGVGVGLCLARPRTKHAKKS